MSVIYEYFNKHTNAQQRAELERVRAIVHKTLPEAEEVITYGMPGFRYKKKYLISFGAFKDHLSVFPGSESIAVLQDELKDFKQSKGTIQFTADHQLPESTIKAIITQRQAEIDNS